METVILTTEQLSLIENEVTDITVRRKLIEYISAHDIIEKDIFHILDEANDKISFVDPLAYIPMSKSVFLKRLPICLYSSGGEIENLGSFSQYAMGLYRENQKSGKIGLYAEKIEELYQIVERMYYHHQLDLKTIFNYPIIQTGYVSRTTFLMQWAHYLDLIENVGFKSKTPDRFIYEYNVALEEANLNPIIYEIEEQYIGEFIYRNGNVFRVEGVIPCDDKGHPVLRWIGVKVINPTKIWATTKKESKGYLYIEANPKTVIYGLNCWGPCDDGSDCWYPLYTGPLLMEFDYEMLKMLRQQAKLTQKQVAEAIGTAERTYQKWESGTTTPDCHYLLRLMNILDIRSVNELTKINLNE